MNKIKPENVKKLIAVLTAGCFLFSFIIAQPVRAAIDLNAAAQKASTALDGFVLPYSIGRITESWPANPKAHGAGSTAGIGGLSFIVIQDLHCHPEVQKNISDILSIIEAHDDCPAIFVEGAAGAVDTSWLNGILDKELRQKIALSLLNQGKLTGAEYYSSISEKHGAIRGLENEKLYAENALRLREILNKRSAIEQAISHM